MPKWKSIETAPKDGTPILGYQRGWFINGGEINITTWNPIWGTWQIPSSDWRPTHWMPLPDPPTAQSEKTE